MEEIGRRLGGLLLPLIGKVPELCETGILFIHLGATADQDLEIPT